MGILLVTAYNREVEQGRRDGYTKGYSKYSRRPRVRTASLASLPVPLAMSCWWTRHRSAARSTRRRKQQVIADGIIE